MEREYWQESSGSGYDDDVPWRTSAVAVKWLMIITTVTFFAGVIWTRDQGRVSVPLEWLGLTQTDFLHGQIWRVITFGFIDDRDAFLAFVFNMLFLWWFGKQLEQMYGTREFTAFYLCSILACATGYLLWSFVMPSTNPLHGSAAPGLAVLMLYTMHFPRQRIWVLFGLFSVELRWIAALTILFHTYIIAHEVGQYGYGASLGSAASLLGILFAYLYYKQNWRIAQSLPELSWSRFRRSFRQWNTRSRLKVVATEEPADRLEAEVDRILAKISEHGEASLTAKERALLEKASRAYRERL